MDYRRYLPGFLRFRPLPQLLIGLAVIVVVVLLGSRLLFSGGSAAEDASATGVSYVQLATVGELSADAGPLSVVGTVKSRSEATILAQTAGELRTLSRSIGDTVGAGSVIGQFENASQRAAVTQAQGAYDAAAAALSKLTGTTATNLGLSSSQASTAALNASVSLSTALRSTYAALDDAVHAKADTFFTGPNSPTPRFLPFTVPDTQLVTDIESERLALNATMRDAETAAAGAELSTDTTRLLSDARTVQAFLDDLIAAMNQAVPNNYFTQTQISANQATLSGARSAVLAAISALTGAKTAYDAAVSGAATASNTAGSGAASDIAAAQAQLKSAQGALDAARAALEKTIVRSPISGTIVSMPVTQGDFVSNFAQIAVVSNPGALYVESQVTPDDAKTIGVGNGAVIAGSVQGRITFVAPALDPATGKIQVKVGITGTQAGLTDGEAVTVSLGRTPRASVGANRPKEIAIPIVALKVTPAGPVVFTVSTSSALVAQPVTLGTILGDRVIVSGIAADTEIITDARGHSAGEVVVVATSTAAY